MSIVVDTSFSVPPPPLNFSVPPPSTNTFIPTNYRFQGPIPLNIRSANMGGGPPRHPMTKGGPPLDLDFDGKRLRKSGLRKTVDYNASLIRMLQNRIWQRDHRDRPFLQPDILYTPQLLPPQCYVDNSVNAVTTAFVKTVTNKIRCPVFCLAWTPEGRRLITGASSGEFTLWNGLTFNFETILQAHDSPVRSMVWSHNGNWMTTGDHTGFIKYWQSNMNNVKMFQAHNEAVRGISFSQSDDKFATCSDDGTIRIWDFFTNREEKILRGHGADVKCIDWHPHKGLLISGSKDNQQPIKLWDPKTGQSLATLHAHKSTVMDVKWNANGNWVVSASRDHLLKLFDIRNLSHEVQTFRGHKKEASTIAWHPYHENLFCSGGSDGAILFWNVGVDKFVGSVDQAHDSIVWSLAWHPLGEVLCSGSNDYTCKFWTRNRPGDKMTGKYHSVNTVSNMLKTDNMTADALSTIPGMGLEDITDEETNRATVDNTTIPLLDIIATNEEPAKLRPIKKIPYSKPIPKNFQKFWNEYKTNDDIVEEDGDENVGPDNDVVNNVVESLMDLIPGSRPASELKPESLLVYGQMIKVDQNSQLAFAIKEGRDSLMRLLHSGAIPEVRQHLSFESNRDPIYLYAAKHLQKDQDLRRNPFSNNSNFPISQDVDLRVNNNFNQPYGPPNNYQTGPPNDNFNRPPINHILPNSNGYNQPMRSYYNKSHPYNNSSQNNNRPPRQYAPYQNNMRNGPPNLMDSNFTRPPNYRSNPERPPQNYNNM
ncbi:pre-mRNA 3' end processing protein WDR33 [Adelges cooleyi]|uniref:pre-mRNA 3' end processing protein WDR33 n=1 Tax=Adelges cooleyi TaxID=133065 RepID=UPI0021801E85|nr:pre-mRNA 3' end processing protein WDR33 [Adelges cooleyi]